VRLGLLYPTDSWMECFENLNRWFNMRPGGATREKWRILDGKVSEWSIFMFGALKVVAPIGVD
jgi:hypothetical protein